MNLSDNIFKPERYSYNDYKLWEGNWELVNGYPYAMSPSPNRVHQLYCSNFCRQIGNVIKANKSGCDWEVYLALDWIVNDNTVVRPDLMIVCGDFKEDFLTFPPGLILEVSSHSTRLRDRNTKFNLYEICGVKYFIIADCDKETVEVFELTNNKYREITTNQFNLGTDCSFHFDALSVFA
jgi:Uma2 family endonuclease